jgi:hypothetical protein
LQRIERSIYRAMQELRRLQKDRLPEGEWIDPEEEEADELARETKPTGENSENGKPKKEEEDGFEDEDDDEDEDEGDTGASASEGVALGCETKPTAENSDYPPAAAPSCGSSVGMADCQQCP